MPAPRTEPLTQLQWELERLAEAARDLALLLEVELVLTTPTGRPPATNPAPPELGLRGRLPDAKGV